MTKKKPAKKPAKPRVSTITPDGKILTCSGKLLDEKDANKPSLRRTSNTSDKSDDSKKDDDRPTLKRRDDSN